MDPMSWSLSGKFTVKQNSNRKRLPNEPLSIAKKKSKKETF